MLAYKKKIYVNVAQLPKIGTVDLECIPWWADGLVAVDINKHQYEVTTLEGAMIAKEGDWLVKGAHDEVYAIDDTIFRETYILSEGEEDEV